MEVVNLHKDEAAKAEVDLDKIDPAPTSEDTRVYFKAISQELTPAQRRIIESPENTYPQQENVLAVHWHPEFIPMDLVEERVENLYPNRDQELIIPTQHNVLMNWGEYSGVEVDCFSSGFNRKVQLLMHFKTDKVKQAGVFKAMLEHTFRYRSSQLFDFLETLTREDHDDRRQEAARLTNTDPDVVRFTSLYAGKLMALIDRHWTETPRSSIKNKLLREFLDSQRKTCPDRLVNKAQVFAKAVKKVVKRHFSLTYFYRATEIIEEARSLGAGIVIPHPEQFWPILLADYDVDGIEVWNPQSMEYTEFLIRSVVRQNRTMNRNDRPILVFMGDDCHLSEKIKPADQQDPAKAAREIGLQPAWDDLNVRKSLIMSGVNRARVIQEYKARLA